MRHTKNVAARVVYITILFLVYSGILKYGNQSINTSAYGLFIFMNLAYYLVDSLNFSKVRYKAGDFIATSFINLIVFVIFFMFKKEASYAFMYFMFTGIQTLLRFVFIKILSKVKRVVILGDNEEKVQITKILMRDENYKYLGYIGKGKDSLGHFENIEKIIKEQSIDKVIITDRIDAEEDIVKVLKLKLYGVIISDYLNFMEEVEGKINVKAIDHKWILKSRGFGILNNDLQKRLKRLFDMTLVFMIGVFAFPLMALTVVMMKVSGLIDKKTRGPLFFKQMRIGLGNKPFEIIKFRTMIIKEHWKEVGFDPEKETWTESNDPRITKMGNFMRKTRLDELPQLLNVFRGEMSFVGPRPESVSYVELLEKEVPFYSLRHTVLPGLTGWAQVMYPYGASVEDALHKMEYDLYYIKHQNFVMDLMIFFKTVKTVVFGRGR